MEWILQNVEHYIERDNDKEATYIVDYLPNLKYLLRIPGIAKDCKNSMNKFEERVCTPVKRKTDQFLLQSGRLPSHHSFMKTRFYSSVFLSLLSVHLILEARKKGMSLNRFKWTQ